MKLVYSVFTYLLEDSFSKNLDSVNERFPFQSYSSSMRRKGLLMIGWDFYTDDPIESNVMIDANITASIADGKYEEAAATAFFHGLNLRRTIDALMKSPGNIVYFFIQRGAFETDCNISCKR